MHVAQLVVGTEIIAVDAMMVYRGMDIGTGKPTTADQNQVPHHCLDLQDASERFTVADFQQHANEALTSIASRDGHALLVAGTGMYLQAVIDGFTLPGEFPEIRAELESLPVEELFGRLSAVDPEAAAKIEPTNSRRLVRALEVCLGSGRRFSSFGPGANVYPPTEFRQVGILWPRPELAQRIEIRVHSMIEAGWVEEVRKLLAMPAPLSLTARQALGYKELISHLEGHMSLDHAVAETILRTRQFAVRQERWFRRDPRIDWVNVDAGENLVEQVVPKVLNCLGRN
jgi:tRNA dimethylallyltransferase